MSSILDINYDAVDAAADAIYGLAEDATGNCTEFHRATDNLMWLGRASDAFAAKQKNCGREMLKIAFALSDLSKSMHAAAAEGRRLQEIERERIRREQELANQQGLPVPE